MLSEKIMKRLRSYPVKQWRYTDSCEFIMDKNGLKICLIPRHDEVKINEEVFDMSQPPDVKKEFKDYVTKIRHHLSDVKNKRRENLVDKL